MFQDSELKVTDAKMMEWKDFDDKSTGTFTETITPQKLCDLMGWLEPPKLAKKSYTYDMRKILGQLTEDEIENLEKREAKELKVKRGKAKIRKLMERAL